MVSIKSTLPNDEREAQDSRYNPSEQAYQEGIGVKHENRGVKKESALINQSANSEDIRGQENSAPWKNNTGTSGPIDKTRLQRALGIAKKRGPLFGILGLLGVGGGLLAGFLGPASMLMSTMENFINSNDTSSSSLERRFMKVFTNATKEDEAGLCASSTKIKCKQQRISNSSLSKLAAKGVVAFDSSGPLELKRIGYPAKNPSGYTITMPDGTTKNVTASQLPGFLVENPKIASKVLGVQGAFNLRVKAWTGKHITNKLYKKFGIKRSGGIADSKNKTGLYADAIKKLRDKIPGLEKLSTVADGVSTKVDKHLGKAKKGGAGYTLAVASCIAVKAPGYIAAGVAAVQLAQVMPVVMDTVLSPGSKLKASGVNETEFTSEDMAATGALLTEQHPRESDGKMSSALDSPYLLAAMGINTNKLEVPGDYVPGYSILTSSLVIAASQADKDMAPACNGILSPAAMYSAMAVDAGVTVALSSTIIGGVIKIAAGWAISEVVSQVASAVAGDAARTAITDLASSDTIASAQGEDLGTVIGVSTMTFFPSGAMARNIPGLKESQIDEATAVRQESEDFRREMDIASLSPFDTSSPYTFMGSIMYKLGQASIISGSYTRGFTSLFSDALRNPFGSNLKASAATAQNEQTCGYAEEYGLVPEKEEDTPAINIAGMPCTGLTLTQASMSSETATDLLIGEGWIDNSIDVADDATIDDLIETGVIKSDTPLYDYITDCSDASTGNYLFNAASCTIDGSVGDANSITTSFNSVEGSCSDEACITEPAADSGITQASGLVNSSSMDAIPVFLLDYQTLQIVNDEDEEENSATANTATGDVVAPVSAGFTITGGFGPRVPPCSTCSNWHQGTDFTSGDKAVYAIQAGEVISAGTGANNIVTIKHADGLISSYWHMAPANVKVTAGDTVTAGQQIGVMGRYGQATGVHLHLEIDISGVADLSLYDAYAKSTGGTNAGKRINPVDYLSKNGVAGF